MIDTQAIRSKILDLAMRGQLTEQLPEDESVETLYHEIATAKQALIKEGKIKKEKPMAIISEEDRPFAIPCRWRWVYLGELFQHNTGKALNSSDTQGQQLEYITTSNLYWDRFVLDDLKTMPFTDSEIEKCTVKKGDLLVCEGGDIGRSAIWPYDYDMRIQNHIHRLRKYCASICTEFYYYLLWHYKQTGRINGIGIGLQGFSAKRVHSLVVPLVPTKEAERVVEVIKQAFSVLDTIDALQAQYADNLTVLKAKLIDAAIQGKLTEQLQEDGTAEELYRQIQSEKQVLIKAGKIKKEKPLPDIADDEVPFEIPATWKWVRLKDICTKIIDGDHNPPAGVPGTTEYLMLSAQNINNGKLTNLDKARYLTSEVFEEENKRTQLRKGDVLLTIVGTIGRSCVFQGGYNICFQRSVAVITTLVDSKYLKYSLDIPFVQGFMEANATGAAQLGFYLNKLEKLLIPIAPIAEQKRIVARLEELLPLCD